MLYGALKLAYGPVKRACAHGTTHNPARGCRGWGGSYVINSKSSVCALVFGAVFFRLDRRWTSLTCKAVNERNVERGRSACGCKGGV